MVIYQQLDGIKQYRACAFEADPRFPRTEYDPEGHLRLIAGLPGNRHGLIDLYNAIPTDLANQLRETSESGCEGFDFRIRENAGERQCQASNVTTRASHVRMRIGA